MRGKPKKGVKGSNKKNASFGSGNNNKSRKIVDVSIPSGFNVLMIYSIVIAVFYLFVMFTTDISLFFGFVVKDVLASLTNFLFFGFMLAIIFGIAYRRKWLYRFAIFAYVFSIINSLISLFMLRSLEEVVLLSLHNFLVPFILLSIFMNALTLWYVLEKSKELRSFQGKSDMIDKVFMYIVSLFYIFLCLFFIIVIVGSYGALVFNMDLMMGVVTTTSMAEAQAYCEKLDGSKMDACFLFVVNTYSEDDDIEKLCTVISSDVYRLTCFKLLDEKVMT